MELKQITRLAEITDTKIIFLVLDGLGGLPRDRGGLTALEEAETPHLDRLAAEGICGLHIPVREGITPGSGPSHIGLFGYDPIEYQVGRGVLSALGIDFDLHPSDVAARGNFCTIDDQGRVTDRRAGRINTEKNRELVQLLRSIKLDGAEVFLETVKEYRFLLVLRGEGLSDQLQNVDPQETGVLPLTPDPYTKEAQKTSGLISEFLRQAGEILSNQSPANMVLLRGFSQQPNWLNFEDIYGVRAAAIAAYPMYLGLAKLIGMKAFTASSSVEGGLEILKSQWDDHDFFFLHIKKADSYGEDGDFDKKAEIIAEADQIIPSLMALRPDVFVVTGDHSTPAKLRSHSWHPVPVLIWSEHCRSDEVKSFGERSCIKGALGPRIPSTALMPIAMANALRLKKYGA